jgi:transposase
MKSYSLDLRARIVEARAKGATIAQTAQRFGVSEKTVWNYVKLERTTGQLGPGKHGGHRVSRLRGHDDTLRAWIAKQPDLTLAEMLERLSKERKINISQTALNFRLKKLGLSFKKNAAGRGTRAPSDQSAPAPMAAPAKGLGHAPARVPG